MKTRTGKFSIGFRRGGSQWQKDMSGMLKWASENDIEVIDLGRDADQAAGQVIDAGLKVGSVDLRNWQGMLAEDTDKRKAAVSENAEYIQACAKYGPMNHFLVMLPDNADLPRAKNFEFMLASLEELVPTLEQHEAHLVIEGWPGPGALCCTPEGYRALLEKQPSKAVGINFDPSHLIRMGIDPIRFLREFGDRVYHIHGKDTEILSERLYEYGSEQPPTFGSRVRFGSMHWRYTIPGHGIMRWIEGFRILESKGYSGCVSIELEDANFNGSEETEKFGLLHGALYLRGC